jgi:hypothetical protein
MADVMPTTSAGADALAVVLSDKLDGIAARLQTIGERRGPIAVRAGLGDAAAQKQLVALEAEEASVQTEKSSVAAALEHVRQLRDELATKEAEADRVRKLKDWPRLKAEAVAKARAYDEALKAAFAALAERDAAVDALLALRVDEVGEEAMSRHKGDVGVAAAAILELGGRRLFPREQFTAGMALAEADELRLVLSGQVAAELRFWLTSAKPSAA